jgi:PTS system nitrogen regulatory IIA component
MRLNEILTVDRITTNPSVTDKESVLRVLARLFSNGDSAPPEGIIYNVLAEREKLLSTGIGNGIAIPHARVRDIDAVRAAVAVCPAGVSFDAVDAEPVQLFVALLAPDGDPNQQLRTLARISKLLRDDTFKRRLVAAETPQRILDIMVEREERLAATP